MTAARKTVFTRIAILIGFVGLLTWFFLWKTGTTWQYETVQEGVLYRCAARTGEEFAAAAIKAYPTGLVVAGTAEELKGEALTDAVNYGHKSRARVNTFTVVQAPSSEQVQRFLEYVTTPRRQPVLMVDADGRPTGMFAAAYRLSVMKLPLEQVEKLAAASDAPAPVVEEVRAYARRYAAELANPSSAPAAPPVPATPAVPLGPAVPE